MELDDLDSADRSRGRISCHSDDSYTRLPHSACIWPGIHDKSKNVTNKVPINEFVSTRTFSGLQNAATRGRELNPEQLVMGNDDSIIGASSQLVDSNDLTDGVDQRSKKIDMSFNYLDAASLIFSIVSFCLDLITDIAVACFHYLNNDYWYCALTLTFIMLPTLITTGISLRWYIVDSKLEGSPPVSKSQWSMRFIFHILQVGPVLRYYESLQYGLRFRETKDINEKRKIYMRMIYEDADATMLRLFESFMESAPQLILQIYIITQNYPFNDYEYLTTIVQVMSITSSLISISWSLVSYSKSLRISLPNKIPMTYWSISIMFLWEFFSVTARMMALALFTSTFVRYVGFVILIHWALMTLWIITMKTNFCNSKCEELGFDAVLGVIFIFCYFNPVDNATRYRYLAFYLFMFVENTTLMILWANYATYEIYFKLLILRLHYTSFFLGIFLMVLSSNERFEDISNLMQRISDLNPTVCI